VDYYKYLGVWLNCKLSFQTRFLFRSKASFNYAAKHSLVKLTILPILDFGDVIYKIASNTLLCKLDAVYHSAICFVNKAPYTTHHCDLYALVSLSSCHVRRQTHWLRVIYKYFLSKAPPYLSSLVTITATHQLSAANDWNKLQKSLKLESYISLTNFKHQLSEQLTDHCTCTQPICK
jgi:hypothetical protein